MFAIRAAKPDLLPALRCGSQFFDRKRDIAILRGTDERSPAIRWNRVAAPPLLHDPILDVKIAGQFIERWPPTEDILETLHRPRGYETYLSLSSTTCTRFLGTIRAAMSKPHERLKQARIAAGFATAKGAAERFHWGYEAYKKHESGEHGFNNDQAREYGRAYKVSAGWLLTGEPGKYADLSGDERALLEMYRNLRRSEKLVVRDQCSSLLRHRAAGEEESS